VAALEDKIVQRATVAVLNAIYEEDFLGFSYGFRPKRSQHDAPRDKPVGRRLTDALVVGITGKKGELDSRCGHPILLRLGQPRMPNPFRGTSGR
jgi:hypothetical protein